MCDLNENERSTVIRLLKKQASNRRTRAKASGFQPEPGKRNADETAAGHLEGIVKKMEAKNGKAKQS
jgi:hypothetical protein